MLDNIFKNLGNNFVLTLLPKIPVFQPSNKLLILWEFLVCVFFLIEIFAISIRLFFMEVWEPFDSHQGKISFLSLGVILVIELFLRLNTAIYRNGVVTYDRGTIIKTHFKSGLLLYDLAAFFAFFLPLQDYHSDNSKQALRVALISSPWNAFKLLFLLKLKNVSHLFEHIEQMFYSDEFYEGVLDLIKLVSQILLISHILACFWNFSAIVGIKNDNPNWVEEKLGPINGQDNWKKQYLYSWYWGLTTMITVGYGDIYAHNDFEVVISAISMLLGCGFFAYAINSIGFIVEKFDLKRKNLMKDLRVIKNFMKKNNLEYQLQVRVYKYLENQSLEEENENRKKEEAVLCKLSDSLRREVLIQSNWKILKGFSTFAKHFSKETLERLSLIVKVVNLAPNEIVFQEGLINDNKIYFLTKGEIDLFWTNRKSKTQSVHILKHIRAGECFGQLNFFEDTARILNARSSALSTLYTINREDFLLVLKDCPEELEIFYQIRDKIRLYNDLSALEISCESCGQAFHKFNQCPFLNYTPNRELVLRRHLYTEMQPTQKTLRKRNLRSGNALYIKKNLSLLQGLFQSELSEYNSMESLKEEDEEQVLSFTEKTYELELDSPEKCEVPIHMQTKSSFLSRREMGGPPALITKAHQNENFHDFAEQMEERDIFSPIRKKNIKGKPPQFERALSQGEREEKSALLRKRIPDDRRSKIHFEEFQEHDIHIPKIFGGLNTEKMKEFTLYYPHNNASYVLDYFNKKRKKNRSQKLKKKLSIFGQFARSINQNRNVVSAIVENHNQQRHYASHISPLHKKKASQEKKLRANFLNLYDLEVFKPLEKAERPLSFHD